MARQHSRFGVWILALLMSFALFGAKPVFAANPNQPRVESAGWTNLSFSQVRAEVKFGVTANFDGSLAPQGRFEYFNTQSGFNASGKVTFWSVTTACQQPVPSGAKAVHVH